MVRTTPRSTEWILTLILLSILLSLILIAKIQSILLESPPTSSVPVVSVEVEGAVEKPGIYSLEAGTSVGEFLKRVHPHRFANLRDLPLDSLINEDRVMFLEELKSVKVLVDNTELEVPIGTRICDLKKFVKTPDSKILKSQRILKDGEKIRISEIVDK